MAESRRAGLRLPDGSRIEVLKAEVDLDTFLVWCKAMALDVDANARIRYGTK